MKLKKKELFKLISSPIAAITMSAVASSAFAATALDNGTALTNLSGATGSDVFYELAVPAGASNLSFNTSGGSGDVDLYIKFGSQASSSNWDCRPYQYGNNEVCDISNVQQGTYSVMLNAYSSYGDVTLSASYDEAGAPPPPPPPSASGVTAAAAAGDSITRAFGADCTYNTSLWGLWCIAGNADQPWHSWFDGWNSSVNSVHDRYKAIDPNITANKDAAQTGAEMVGTNDTERPFAEQAAMIVAQSPVPDHVETIFGGNDICSRDCVDPNNCDDPLYTGEEWRQALRSGLNTLMSGLPAGSSIVMGSVPRVQDIRQAGVDKQAADEYVDCDSLWSSYDVCRIVTDPGTLNGESMAVRHAGVAAAQQQYNAITRAEVEAYNSNANGLNPNGIELVSDYVDESTPSGGTFAFGADEINGADCFHPNVATQSVIADYMWNANPFKQ
jgi:Bacterial pre-peptidase C-terminal domain